MIVYCSLELFALPLHQIEAFSTNEHELSQVQKSLRDCFMEAKHDAQREVARFSDDRVKLYGHVSWPDDTVGTPIN